MGKDDLENGGTIKPVFLIRTLVKAYKTLVKEEPAMRTHAAREIALLRNPKTMAEALRTPQRVEWIDIINKEMSSLLEKEVHEIRKIPVGRELIPTKLVLKIKPASDGSIDKYKTICVVAGYRPTAGLDYDPKGVYSPMAEPTTLRLVLAISSALKLKIDHLEIRTAFLNGEIPENEQFFCSSPPGSEWQMAWEGSLRRAYTEHTNLDPYGRRPSALGCTRTTPNMSKLKRTMRLRDARSRRACIHQP